MSRLGGKGAVLGGDSRAAIAVRCGESFLGGCENRLWAHRCVIFAGVNGVDIHRLDTMVSPSVP